MKNLRIPALVVSTVINTVVAGYMFGPVISVIGVGIFCLIGAMLYKHVSEEDTINSMTILSLSILALLVGAIVINYLSLFLFIAAVLGLGWYLHFHPNKSNKFLK